MTASWTVPASHRRADHGLEALLVGFRVLAHGLDQHVDAVVRAERRLAAQIHGGDLVELRPHDLEGREL